LIDEPETVNLAIASSMLLRTAAYPDSGGGSEESKMLYPSVFESIGIPSIGFVCGYLAAKYQATHPRVGSVATGAEILAGAISLLTCLGMILIHLLRNGWFSRTFEELCIDLRVVVIIGLATFISGWPFARRGQAVFERLRRD